MTLWYQIHLLAQQIPHCHRPSTLSAALGSPAALCAASVCCIFCILYFGSINPICCTHTLDQQTYLLLLSSLLFSFLSSRIKFSFSFGFPPISLSLVRTILNNLHAGSLGCAPTPNQYFARDMSSFISFIGLPSPSPSSAEPKGGILGIGS